MKRLLLEAKYVAILTGIDEKDIYRAYREGSMPRWRIKGKKGIFFELADIEKIFKISCPKYLKRKNRRRKRCK